MGRVGGESPDVADAASKHPLERVADGSTGSPTFIPSLAKRNRSEGEPSPSIYKKDRGISATVFNALWRFPVKPGMTVGETSYCLLPTTPLQ